MEGEKIPEEFRKIQIERDAFDYFFGFVLLAGAHLRTLPENEVGAYIALDYLELKSLLAEKKLNFTLETMDRLERAIEPRFKDSTAAGNSAILDGIIRLFHDEPEEGNNAP